MAAPKKGRPHWRGRQRTRTVFVVHFLPVAAVAALARTTTLGWVFCQPTTFNVGLDFLPNRVAIGADSKLDHRYGMGVLAAHTLDLVGKIDHAVPSPPRRGREGESLCGQRIEQVDEAGVLPRVTHFFAVRAELPLSSIVVAKLVTVWRRPPLSLKR